ncbi:hypothetical protein EV182_007293, partial [Spiromyces aspiralis]
TSGHTNSSSSHDSGKSSSSGSKKLSTGVIVVIVVVVVVVVILLAVLGYILWRRHLQKVHDEKMAEEFSHLPAFAEPGLPPSKSHHPHSNPPVNFGNPAINTGDPNQIFLRELNES